MLPSEERQSSAWPWTAAAVIGIAMAHAPALASGLLDADRLLLVRNNDLRSFSGLGSLLVRGEPVERAYGLILHQRAPLAVVSTWLGWEWLRADALLQHAAGLVLALAVATALLWLLAPRPRFAAVAALALMLHPVAADVTGPIAARPALLAVWAALVTARRARDAAAPAAALGWTAAGTLCACLLSPAWGLLGLLPAAMIGQARLRRAAAVVALALTCVALVLLRADFSGLALVDALGPGAGCVFFQWLPSHRPWVAGTVTDWHIAGLVPVIMLIGAALVGAARAPRASDAALLRAAAAAMLASVVASALSCRASTVTGTAAFLLHLGVVLAAAGVLGSKPRASLRPWGWALVMGVGLGSAAVTAWRTRSWAGEDRILAAVAARDGDRAEGVLANARMALRRGSLAEALPYCERFAELSPDSARAHGCLAAGALSAGDEQAAFVLMRSWAGQFSEQRALRAAVLELAESQSHPRFAELFRRASGFNMPSRRPGERR